MDVVISGSVTKTSINAVIFLDAGDPLITNYGLEIAKLRPFCTKIIMIERLV